MVAGTGNLHVGGHVVQFYGRDEDLAQRVADYLLGALRRGGVAIVIATADHRREFEVRLRRAGADLIEAAARGAYLVLDAGKAVREIVSVGRPDSSDFDRVIGGLIARACKGGRLVRAYGEMVSLLWDKGLVNAAVQLESLWNDLGRRHRFSLFYGHPMAEVAREGRRVTAFAEVCRLHRESIGGVSPGAAARYGVPGSLRTFAYSAEAPADARHFAVGALRRWGAADLTEDVALVVTELAANAIVHACSGFTLAMSAQQDMLRISVRDTTPLPAESDALLPAPLHGLGAVDALAIRWGVESLGSAGKEVWVELPR